MAFSASNKNFVICEGKLSTAIGVGSNKGPIYLTVLMYLMADSAKLISTAPAHIEDF